MNKPLLIVVTGRPASGKSTLAGIIAKAIKCPLISRDQLKEGYINTLGIQHDQLDDSAALHIYQVFFEVIGHLVSRGISVVVEAAFQDHLWRPQLLLLRDKAEIRVVICRIEPDLAKRRFADRLMSDPDRDRFHGDNLARDKAGLVTETYVSLNMDVPTLLVDTTNQYRPPLPEVLDFIQRPIASTSEPASKNPPTP